VRRQQQAGHGRAHQHRIAQRMDALAEGAVADLVVGLQERHEGRRRQPRARLAAPLAAFRNAEGCPW
jgi:hypothetical protein